MRISLTVLMCLSLLRPVLGEMGTSNPEHARQEVTKRADRLQAEYNRANNIIQSVEDKAADLSSVVAGGLPKAPIEKLQKFRGLGRPLNREEIDEVLGLAGEINDGLAALQGEMRKRVESLDATLVDLDQQFAEIPPRIRSVAHDQKEVLNMVQDMGNGLVAQIKDLESKIAAEENELQKRVLKTHLRRLEITLQGYTADRRLGANVLKIMESLEASYPQEEARIELTRATLRLLTSLLDANLQTRESVNTVRSVVKTYNMTLKQSNLAGVELQNAASVIEAYTTSMLPVLELIDPHLLTESSMDEDMGNHVETNGNAIENWERGL